MDATVNGLSNEQWGGLVKKPGARPGDSRNHAPSDRRRDGPDRRDAGGDQTRDGKRDGKNRGQSDDLGGRGQPGTGRAARWLGIPELWRGTGVAAVWRAVQIHLKARYPACATESCAPRSFDWRAFSWGTFSWRAWAGLPQGSARESVLLEGRSYCGDCWPGALAQRFADCPPVPAPLTRPAHRMPLGLVLLSRGWLTPGQLREGLERQRRLSGRLGESLRALGYIHEDEIAAGLAAQWACPVLLFRSAVAESHLRRVPLRLQERHRMVSVHYAEQTNVLVLAFSQGVDYALTQALAGMLECRIEPCVAPETEVRRHLAQLQDLERSSEITFERIREASERTAITESYVRCWGAHSVRVAACGTSVWARLEKAGETLDLLFEGAAPEASAA